jgi:hypothetical protein
MTQTFMYPQVTQIVRRAHGVPASWLRPGRFRRAARAIASGRWPPSRRASSGPLALGVSTRATS